MKKRKTKFHKKSQRKKQRNLITLICVLCLFVIAVTLYCLGCHNLDDEVIWGNVTINGISVGGLTRDDASLAVHSQFAKEYRDTALKVDLAGNEYEVDVFPALGFKATDTISRVYDPGHGLWIARGFDWLVTKLKGNQSYTIYPYVKDMEALDKAVEKSKILNYNKSVEPKWSIKDDTLVIRKGKEGAAIDEDQLKQNLVKALEEHKYTEVISCPAVMTPPKEADIQKIYEKVHAEAKNATLDREKDYEIVPAVKGIEFDVAKAKEIYNRTEYGQKAIIPIQVTEPEITTEDMETNLFSNVLASYSTYGGGSYERSSNISLAAEACNGTILLPGETFSYNEALGERTLDRGYQMAGAYSSNEVIQEVGGGICQVSSTIFAAVLFTELNVTARQNHSLPVSYVPLGMDATVSWGGPEFMFTNSYNYPVRLDVYFDGYTVTAEIVGTNEYNHIVDVYREYNSEYSVNTFRVVYDSNWNQLSNVQIATSNYTTQEPTPTPQPEVTQPPEENPDNSGDDSGDWNNGDGDSSDGSGDGGSGDGSDGSGDWGNGDGSEDWGNGDGDGSGDWETDGETDGSEDWQVEYGE